MDRSGTSKENERKEIIVISSDSEDEREAEGDNQIIVISSGSSESEGETEGDSEYWGDEESGLEAVDENESVTESQGQEIWEDAGTDTESNESNVTQYTDGSGKEGSGEISEQSVVEQERIIWHQPERGVKRHFSDISDED